MPIRLIGMVHLGPLPGSPGFTGDFPSLLDAAVQDAATLADAGFDAVMIENFGDVPFFGDDVPKVTVAAMTRAATEIRRAVTVPLGVNVLRNDALAALAIASACEADFIRVNVLSGEMHTDQGTLTGRAAELSRARAVLCPQVMVFADVFVKHAVPPAGLTIAQAAADTFLRAGADALIVSGAATGAGTDTARLAEVRAAVPDAELLVGSGASAATIARLLEHADGAIVGTAIKEDGQTTAPVDPNRAAEFVRAARANR